METHNDVVGSSESIIAHKRHAEFACTIDPAHDVFARLLESAPRVHRSMDKRHHSSSE